MKTTISIDDLLTVTSDMLEANEGDDATQCLLICFAAELADVSVGKMRELLAMSSFELLMKEV